MNLRRYVHLYVLCSITYNCQDILFSCSVMSNSFATPWTRARRASLSMGFSVHDYCSGLPFPSSGDLPDSGIKPVSPCLLHCRQILYHWATREAHTKRWKQSKYSSMNEWVKKRWMCVCVYIYPYIYMYILIHIYMYTYVYVYIYTHMYIHISSYMYIHIYRCIYINMYTYVCVYIYTYIHMYIHIYPYI